MVIFNDSISDGGGTKTDEFLENFQKMGGGFLINQKIYIADFGLLYKALKRVFRKKIAT